MLPFRLKIFLWFSTIIKLSICKKFQSQNPQSLETKYLQKFVGGFVIWFTYTLFFLNLCWTLFFAKRTFICIYQSIIFAYGFLSKTRMTKNIDWFYFYWILINGIFRSSHIVNLYILSKLMIRINTGTQIVIVLGLIKKPSNVKFWNIKSKNWLILLVSASGKAGNSNQPKTSFSKPNIRFSKASIIIS